MKSCRRGLAALLFAALAHARVRLAADGRRSSQRAHHLHRRPGHARRRVLWRGGPANAEHGCPSPSRRSLHPDVCPLGDLLVVASGVDDRADPPPGPGVPSNVSSHEGVAGMPHEEVTIADMMHEAGYATGHIGKWHLGYTPETMPNGQGFDYSFGHMGGCIDNYSHFFYWQGPNRHDLWRNGQEIWEDGRYFSDLMAEECEAFLDKHADRPFFIYWANNVPHYPLQGTAKWREVYKDLPSPRDKYAAFVSTLDERIGRVIAKIDELGLRKNTLIIFQSDHGHSTEERTFGAGGYCGPYRGAKACLFEGRAADPVDRFHARHDPRGRHP